MQNETGANGSAPVAEQPRDWYFTFGGDHTLPTGESLKNAYVVLHGTCDGTRGRMFEVFGNRWAFQYKSAEAAGVEKYGMTEVKLPGVTQ